MQIKSLHLVIYIRILNGHINAVTALFPVLNVIGLIAALKHNPYPLLSLYVVSDDK